ncbi:MAG: phosphate acyltransferase PlsX [Nitrospirota bacterium]|nr:phosphate acyltransferase PlsX [Nitrospirota bacterium]
MKIAVDAMGGDHGLAPIVEGALQALKERDVELILVGQEDQIKEQLMRLNCTDSRIGVHHASQIVGMQESGTQVKRKKRDSSIWVATGLVKSGEADAVVSAGNTGATMVSAFLLLGTIKGVERPAIAATLPTLKGTAVMLDVGATVDCTARNLYQFGIMGHEYGQHLLKIENPRVGLMSIGEEDTKGTETTKEAFRLLRESPLNFIGNLEGRDVFSGTADVIVCDGFLGNVSLKISEGLADAMKKMLMREVMDTRLGRLSLVFLTGPLMRLRRRTDYAEFGGAPLLGVNGISMICHGRSSAKAIKNAILRAQALADDRLIESIREDIAETLAKPESPSPQMA